MTNAHAGYPAAIWRQLCNDTPFAWHLRDQASRSPACRLADLVASELRLDAFLDALRIGVHAGQGQDAGLDIRDRGAAFAAVVVGHLAHRPEWIQQGLLAVAEDPARTDELEQALRRLDPSVALATARRYRVQAPAPIRRAARAVLLDLDTLAPATPEVHGADEQDPTVLARLLRRAGDRRLTAWRASAAAAYTADHPELRWSAIRAGTLLGDHRARRPLFELINGGSPYRAPALELLIRSLDPQPQALLLTHVLQSEASPFLKHRAIAAVGSLSAAAMLLQDCAEVHTARSAAHALALITGLDLRAQGLDTADPDPDDKRQHPDCSDPDEPVDQDDWPLPCPERLDGWWQQHRQGFDTALRYLAGQPLERSNLLAVLATGTQPQRRAAALALALADDTTAVFDVHADGPTQRATLAAIAPAAVPCAQESHVGDGTAPRKT